ncbi:arginase family protein [Pontibacter sp. HSC-14F20]|uniref:arginase family protein n=1 Tax=Pontibacter sp. HSC-14F20 TaxID=2864136 RepID=UPI001C73C357|nr:arginase family protein [Pontibacter sp. HSC-14F20]MBX0333526.1 arginase family protein [Pontibacter sp. HSC-14F20]
MNSVTILEFPSNLGLKEPSQGHEPGVRKLPEWLRQHHFHQLIEPEATRVLPPPPYRMHHDLESAVLNADALAQYAREEAKLLNEVLSEQKFPLILGGDCSILIGNALALKQKGDYALFYLDGHTDFIEPPQSGTGGAGGMAAALAAGRGPKKLTDIQGQSPYIREEYVWCVGNREYDDEYEQILRDSQATYFTLDLLRETGIDKGVNSFLNMVEINNLDGFWIHLDVDVLDDEIMPAVDSRTPGGLSYEEFDRILYLLLSSPKATGIEITILDPDLDPSGKYTKLFVQHFTDTFQKARIAK